MSGLCECCGQNPITKVWNGSAWVALPDMGGAPRCWDIRLAPRTAVDNANAARSEMARQ